MNTNFENLVSQVKSMIWAGYERGNLIMERIPQLKQNPRRKNIAWACLMSVVVVFFNMFGGQHLSEEAQVGYDFLEAYLSGDFVEAARYTERPDTINSDVAVMIKLNNGGYANEDRVKIRKETVEALEKLRATIKGIGLWKSDVSFIENKGSWSGKEYSDKDTNISYELKNGRKHQEVELHLQKSEEGVWKVVGHPFKFL